LEYFESEIIEDIAVESVKMVRITFIEAKLFWEKLQTNVIPEYSKIIVDISKCKFIDTTFMGVLVRTHRMLLKEKGELKLVLEKDHMDKFFRAVGVTEIIETNISIEDALNSFKYKDKVGNMVIS
jgi:anti-anti-sigma factor